MFYVSRDFAFCLSFPKLQIDRRLTAIKLYYDIFQMYLVCSMVLGDSHEDGNNL